VELKVAREELRPTSRRALALVISNRIGMPFKEALDIVDAYCDEKEPAVPTYLSSEFVIYWLKAVAVANVAIGIAGIWYGVKLMKAGQLAWPSLCLGTVFVGLGALAWVKSVEKGG